MASPKSYVQPDGTIRVIYEDGRTELWSADRSSIISEQPADARRAAAFFQGGQTLRDVLRELEEFDASPYGQRYNERLRQQAERTRETEDRDFGLREDARDLSRDQFGLSREIQRGNLELNRQQFGEGQRQFDASLAERIREADMSHGMQQSQLGLNYLQARAALSGPGEWGEALDLEAGARSRADTPIFFQRLKENVQSPGFTGPGGIPKALSMEGMMGNMTGGGSQADPRVKQMSDILKASGISAGEGWSAQDLAALNLVGEIAKQGANKSTQAWDSMSPDAQQGFLSLYGKAGGSKQAWLTGINNSRWGGSGVGSRA